MGKKKNVASVHERIIPTKRPNVNFLRIEELRVVIVTHPYGRNLAFLDLSR
jgi:hypothetical protein